MWKLDLDEFYFRIYDSKNQLAGYFDPEYGDVFPKENEQEIIEKMHKDHEKVPGGYIMVPLVKFGIFDSDYESNLSDLMTQIESVSGRLQKWQSFLSSINNPHHFIRISHTDQDMLSITIPLKFSKPTPLEKKSVLEELGPILDQMQKQSLL